MSPFTPEQENAIKRARETIGDRIASWTDEQVLATIEKNNAALEAAGHTIVCAPRAVRH